MVVALEGVLEVSSGEKDLGRGESSSPVSCNEDVKSNNEYSR